MTLLITIYIALLTSVGTHIQRTIGDIESELSQEVRNEEIALKQYNKQYSSDYKAYIWQIQSCNVSRINFYSCSYDRMFNMTFNLQDIRQHYATLTARSKGNPNQTSLYKSRIRRLYFQLEELRRLKPALDPLPDVPESIRMATSDSLLAKAYRLGSDRNAMIDILIPLDSSEQALRLKAINHCRRLIEIHKTYLAKDELLRSLYAELRDDYQQTYNEALVTFKQLQYDIIHKNKYPFYVVADGSYHSVLETDEEDDRYLDWWGRHGGNEAFASLVIIAILGILLSLLIICPILFFTRKKPNILVNLRSHKFFWIRTLCNVIWLILVVLAVRYIPSEILFAGGTTVIIYFLFVIFIRISNIITDSGKHLNDTFRMYSSITSMGFFLMTFRLFFAPDEMLAVFIFPISIVLFIWQIICLRMYWTKINRYDTVIGLCSALILLAMSIASFFGYLYFSFALFYWWQSQVMMLSAIAILLTLFKAYDKNIVSRRVMRYYGTLGLPCNLKDNKPIQITWFADLIQMVALPLLMILSLPICIYFAMTFFNAGEAFNEVFYSEFFSYTSSNGETHILLSLSNLLYVVCLFFCFRYLRHLFVSIYRQVKKDISNRKLAAGKIADSFVNYSLGSNLISFFVWVCYGISVCAILHIPLQSMTLIFSGLAAGIGFALKDVLNNLFYGMQLMAGRLKVGDFVVCDGYRGAVKRISYQTTQILIEEGALVCFTNSELFNKNFQNLTSHNPYEVNWVKFYVPYGCDLQFVDCITREATERLNTKDKYGRPLLSPDEGITIEFSDMGSSSIEMAVRIGVIAQERTLFLPVLRRAIYTELTNNNISIPFNQLDLHIVKDSEGNGLIINKA